MHCWLYYSGKTCILRLVQLSSSYFGYQQGLNTLYILQLVCWDLLLSGCSYCLPFLALFTSNSLLSTYFEDLYWNNIGFWDIMSLHNSFSAPCLVLKPSRTLLWRWTPFCQMMVVESTLCSTFSLISPIAVQFSLVLTSGDCEGHSIQYDSHHFQTIVWSPMPLWKHQCYSGSSSLCLISIFPI